jgi:hypothetical protein
LAGGIQVTAADGTSLGKAYNLLGVVGGSINYPTVFTTASAYTYVLLAEQPRGTGTPKVLVWRNVRDGTVIRDTGFPGVYYTGIDCSGDLYSDVISQLPPQGMASGAWLGDSLHLVMAGATVVPSLKVGSIDSGGSCRNGPWTVGPVNALIDLGTATPLPAPFTLAVAE